MKTRGCYLMILVVYISLWSCQLITCHLTHSLIVLADSYINLYKILDVSLGILHLRKQKQARQYQVDKLMEGEVNKEKISSLFGRQCTYELKRLPVIGSFINGLFLGALLMSAAIEGIQTCFHAHHSDSLGSSSILLEHPVTYPSILVGFAVVGAMMQWCCSKVHEMREEELQSESLLDLRSGFRVDSSKQPSSRQSSQQELDVTKLEPVDRQTTTNSNCLGSGLQAAIESRLADERKFVLNKPRPRSFEPALPGDDPMDADQHSKISLKSLRMGPSMDGDSPGATHHCCRDLELESAGGEPKSGKRLDGWLLVRHCASPVALVSCAMIIYLINDELITEVADAFFAILVVVLLFAASYPPMKQAAKVLLQSASDELDLERLRRSLESISPLVSDVKELQVWSLTAHSNRIGSCHLVFDKRVPVTDKQVALIIRKAQDKFHSQNITRSTVEPVFVDSPKQMDQVHVH